MQEVSVSEDTKPVQEEPEVGDQDDTEGHSLATYEYGRLVARERHQEAERHARDERLRKDQRKGR
jgi:hypothetical protein